MNQQRLMTVALIITVCAVLFGTGMGAVVGIFESNIKGYLSAGVAHNAHIAALPTTEQAEAATKLEKKSWRYVQRSHFHGSGIAALTLGLLLLLRSMPQQGKAHVYLSFTLALSGFAYPFFWLCSGLSAPLIGTSAAKAQWEWIAYAGAIHVLATLGVILLLLGSLKNDGAEIGALT